MEAVVDIADMVGMSDMVNVVDVVDVVGMLDTVNVIDVVDVVNVVDLAVSWAVAGPCDGAAVHLALPWGLSPPPSFSSGSGGASSGRLTPERRSDGA